MAELHTHPKDPSQVVYGERLKAGEVIQPNDVYDATSGKWEEAPFFSGMVLQEGCQTYWVRKEA